MVNGVSLFTRPPHHQAKGEPGCQPRHPVHRTRTPPPTAPRAVHAGLEADPGHPVRGHQCTSISRLADLPAGLHASRVGRGATARATPVSRQSGTGGS